MIGVVILAAWMLVGAVAAIVMTEHRDSRWAHIPMAVILGPLWIAVAVDRRAAP